MYGWSYGKLPPAVCLESGKRRWWVLLHRWLIWIFDPGTLRKNPDTPPRGIGIFGAADRGRTGTLFRARDFKSLVSAYSTTAAWNVDILALSEPFVKGKFLQRFTAEGKFM